jgi:parvulin-like peptidyl-prolyl isomerase
MLFFLLLSFVLLLSSGGILAADIEKEVSSAKKASKSASNEEAKAKQLGYIAIVGGERISMGSYVAALRRGLREKFYHGNIPEEEGKKFRKEVADKLIDRQLMIQEAKRRGLKPDAVEVDANVKAFDEKFKDDPEWKVAREKVLAQLREKLSDDSLVKVLEKTVRAIPEPSEKALRAYYDEHKDLFTTPERVDISLILLRVDPASTPEVWKQANEEAGSILERIQKGADFAELARIHSSDKSAANGGDMGFVHTGMLGVNAQKVLDIMEPGEISAPVVLLEGVAIFRLNEREKPTLNPLEKVKDRATLIYQRETGEKAWTDLLERLRAETKIEVNDAPWR